MSATWWFHCNSCSVRPCANFTKFFLVKCGHVLCLRCLEKAKRACDAARQALHCVCCRKKVVTAEEIGPKMSRRTLRFFKRMEDTMQEMAGEMKEISGFQQMQINLMVRKLKKKGDNNQKSLSQERRQRAEEARTHQLEKAARKAHEELKELQEKYTKMETEFSSMSEKLKETAARDKQTTNSTSNFSLFDHSNTSRSLSFSSHDESSISNIFIPNRLPTHKTPQTRTPMCTTTPKYSFNMSAHRNRPGSMKVGSIIPPGNIPRSMRTPKNG